jgi:16S rRNA (guanine966-N2)-methyltransferase
MRIIAGAWRGRTLAAPVGRDTRPTADRVRQALFDSLMHAPWAGGDAVRGARVLDAFAGTGALGLEALSRGAAHATFFDTDRAALAAIRANVAACGAADRAEVMPADATHPPPASRPCSLVFLDPPYARGLPAAALAALDEARWLAPETLVVIEQSAAEPPLAEPVLLDRVHGAARITVHRHPAIS